MSCAQTHSATGPALQAAFMVMSAVGGKLLLFQAASPSVGVGRIKTRDLPALYGTDRHAASRDPDLCSANIFAELCSLRPVTSQQGCMAMQRCTCQVNLQEVRSEHSALREILK